MLMPLLVIQSNIGKAGILKMLNESQLPTSTLLESLN